MRKLLWVGGGTGGEGVLRCAQDDIHCLGWQEIQVARKSSPRSLIITEVRTSEKEQESLTARGREGFAKDGKDQ